ncbi:hypothetical protein MRX96_034590 [Rhipicephalus microplus]
MEAALSKAVAISPTCRKFSAVTSVLSRNAGVVSAETYIAHVSSAEIEAGRSVEVVVGMKGVARKFSEAGAVVVEAATVVGVAATEVRKVDSTMVGKAEVIESATGMST